jgi:hypothetical protein
LSWSRERSLERSRRAKDRLPPSRPANCEKTNLIRYLSAERVGPSPSDGVAAGEISTIIVRVEPQVQAKLVTFAGRVKAGRMPTVSWP